MTLNVNLKSSQEDIKTSYRKKALELHPDKNKEKNEDGEFKKNTEAYKGQYANTYNYLFKRS